VYVPGHVDTDPPAEVAISGGLAAPKPAGRYGEPAYDYQSNTCANTFCHGAWEVSKTSAPAEAQFAYTGEVMTGANFSPVWTGDDAETECGTCHGLPPPGHVAADLDDCGFCHSGIVDLDGTISDLDLHINGRINTIFSPERPF
jgi:predicted CxxxxCH...CXXCH cytochrome family protein